MNDTELAYMAGIVDGEGYFCISSKPDGDKRKYCQLCVGVNNTDKSLIDWLYSNFGGYYYCHHFPADELIKHKKPVYQWALVSNEAIKFINLIYPFLRIKKKQSELAIEFQKYKQDIKQKRVGRKLTPDEIETMNQFGLRMRSLNRAIPGAEK